MKEFHNRIVRAAECVTNEMFACTWLETEYRLDVLVLQMVPILGSAEHIRNFVRSSV
jgi:hypothetical protein